MKEPVFIVGLSRSGTTLLSKILNASNQLYIGPETHYFYFINKRANRNKKFQDVFFDFLTISKNPFSRYFNIEPSELEYLKKNLTNIHSHKEFLAFFCSYHANKMGLNRWGEKTPRHYFYLKQIYALYPGAKVINLLRDPRAVFQSHQRVEWGTHSPFKFRKLFKKNLEVIDNYLEQTNRFMLVRFEDLVDNPEKTTKNICDFLYIDYSRDMINSLNQQQFQNYDEKMEPWKKNSVYINPSKIEGWKTEGDEKINAFLSFLLKKEIKT